MFYVLICHLYILFGEVFLPVFCLFLISLLDFNVEFWEFIFIYQILAFFVGHVVCKYFSPNLFSLTCSSILLEDSSAKQKCLIVMKSNLAIFPFINHAFGVKSKNSLLSPNSWWLSPMCFTKSFMFLCYIFKSMKHFELIFV